MDATTTPQDPGEPSGRDLARLALAEYKKTTWAIPTNKPSTPKPKAVRRAGTGRDPVGIAAALADLSTDPTWEASLTGGGILDQWATLCPQYVDTVQPLAYDATRGRLDLRPVSHVYAAQLRLLGGQLAKQINDKLGKPAVRTIRVLPPGQTASPAVQPPREEMQPEAPVRTRETACDGYKATREALLAHRGDGLPANPYVRAALERQDAALTDPRNREPETAFTDAVAELARVRGPQLSPSEQARRAALMHKRSGGDAAPVRRAFDVA